jgi:hypothetical protein
LYILDYPVSVKQEESGEVAARIVEAMSSRQRLALRPLFSSSNGIPRRKRVLACTSTSVGNGSGVSGEQRGG